MNDKWFPWIMMILGFGFLFFVLGFALADRYTYMRAYEDLHAGKIESVVKKDYPALWIEHNIPSFKHSVSSQKRSKKTDKEQ